MMATAVSSQWFGPVRYAQGNKEDAKVFGLSRFSIERDCPSHFSFVFARLPNPEINTVFAKHQGFAEEGLDFIINYNIKYRMGRNVGEEDE